MEVIVRKFLPEFDKVILSPLILNEECVGWHSNVVVKSGKPLGGGASSNKETAIRIGFAEVIERAIFKRLINQNKSNFMLKKYPTSSGFAVGFNQKKTQYRSLFEAIERWAWNQWIDKGCTIKNKYLINKNLIKNPLTQFFLQDFDTVTAFQQKINFTFKNQNLSVQLQILICEKDQGVYVGSRVGNDPTDLLEHSALEAFRHYLIAKNNHDRSNEYPFNRIIYFSKNREKAFDQIPTGGFKEWQRPQIKISKEVPTGEKNIFCYRSICKDYICWSQGDEKRFVY